jgi:hypothetical protein
VYEYALLLCMASSWSWSHVNKLDPLSLFSVILHIEPLNLCRLIEYCLQCSDPLSVNLLIRLLIHVSKSCLLLLSVSVVFGPVILLHFACVMLADFGKDGGVGLLLKWVSLSSIIFCSFTVWFLTACNSYFYSGFWLFEFWITRFIYLYFLSSTLIIFSISDM